MTSLPKTLTRDYFQACAQQGLVSPRFVLVIKIAHQTVLLFEKSPASRRLGHKNNNYRLIKKYRCSTSRFGIGEAAGSNMTPRGLHRIAEKIGGGWPVGAVFKNRNFTGYTWDGQPYASITNRIFWLEGLKPGFNRGDNVDSHARYIYIHGTGDEPKIGRPASHGCIHLAASDLIPLYDKLPAGTFVWIG